MTPLKNFVKWLETGQKSKQTMPRWDQNVEEIQELTQGWFSLCMISKVKNFVNHSVLVYLLPL